MSAYPDTLGPLLAGARRTLALPSPFALAAGGALTAAHVAVETWGTLDRAKRNAILVFTGLSASAHAAANRDDPTPGWWEPIVGPGKAIDTDHCFVICVNSLGSCFGSTGPGDVDPATGRRYGGEFPELRVEDIASSAQVVVDALGIQELAAVVGCSLGGMTVLAHAALFPGRARRLLSVSGALAPTAHAIGTRALQREIVGTALRGGAPLEPAMRWARKIGMLSYIGSPLLEARHARREREGERGASGTRFEVEAWLEHQATKFATSFEPWSYWSVSRAMDLFDFAAFGGRERDLAVAAKRLKLEKALVLGVREDLLFPLDQQLSLAATLTGAGIDTDFKELSSPYGHDAFLVEEGIFGPHFARFLEATLPRTSSRRPQPNV
jgi:homoserine O-acetyltransferase/O-succinyltransferase